MLLAGQFVTIKYCIYSAIAAVYSNLATLWIIFWFEEVSSAVCDVNGDSVG